MPTFTLPCKIAVPRRSYCKWSSWSCPQYNRLWLQTQTIMHFRPGHHNFITFSFQRIVGRSQFSSFPLWSQKALGLSHRGKTTPGYPHFGKPCTISDILYLLCRYSYIILGNIWNRRNQKEMRQRLNFFEIKKAFKSSRWGNRHVSVENILVRS